MWLHTYTVMIIYSYAYKETIESLLQFKSGLYNWQCSIAIASLPQGGGSWALTPNRHTAASTKLVYIFQITQK